MQKPATKARFLKAEQSDKHWVVDLLAVAFHDNLSVNYLVKQDGKRGERIKALMSYSFELCLLFGAVWVKAEQTCCALVLYPDKKRRTFRSIGLDLTLIFRVIGFENVAKALTREDAVRKLQPMGELYYLWFLGVKPAHQHQGLGTEMMNHLKRECLDQNRIFCLETSMEKNLPFYKGLGFTLYKQLQLTYTLYFFKLASVG
jgi:ribosomal protein S18 acetylase RimI-like enzyme